MRRELHEGQTTRTLIVVTAVIATYPLKVVGEDAALQIFAKRLSDAGCQGMLVTSVVELSDTYQLKLGLEVVCNRLIDQGTFGLVGVVGFGFASQAQ